MTQPEQTTRQTILMCAPDYFSVDYVINPWMQDGLGKTKHALAWRQWEGLKEGLSAWANLDFIPPQMGWPDMPFAANGAMVRDKKAIISCFRALERRGEEPFFREYFERNNYEIMPWPQSIKFEGAGDALFDREQDLIWMGYGFRSNVKAAPLIGEFFGRRVVTLRLVDPRFYHVDT